MSKFILKPDPNRGPRSLDELADLLELRYPEYKVLKDRDEDVYRKGQRSVIEYIRNIKDKKTFEDGLKQTVQDTGASGDPASDSSPAAIPRRRALATFRRWFSEGG